MKNKGTMKKLTNSDPETKSPNIIARNLGQLKALFPELFTEGKDGVAVNLDVLKQLVGDQTVTDAEEKYGLNWHGKRRARQLALTPSTGTLRPCPADSADWDTTQNLMIEGDNLEVLKLLQKSYAGKVKLIYIDPPYNTGKDFIYPDKFQDNIKNYLALTGQTGDGGRTISSNTEASGRFHTDWLNMMYPRLKLARTLLGADGLIFISIDDHEVDSLRKVCAEVFGEENFVAHFVWNTEGHTDNQFDVKVNHEYVLLYARDANTVHLGRVVDHNTRQQSNLWKGFAENSITKNGPANPPSEVKLPVGFPCTTKAMDLSVSALSSKFFSDAKRDGYISRELSDKYDVTYPIRLDRMRVADGRLADTCRVFSGWANVNKLRAFIANQCQPIEDDGDTVSFYLSDKGVIYYRRNRESARNILSVLRNLGTTEKMRSELEDLGIPFQYPKPKELLRYLLQIGLEGPGIVLDFFAGSGTLAHSVWLQQVEDNVPRRFVLVQLPEPLDPEDEKQRPAVQFCDKLKLPRNIAELTKERLRRTGATIREKNALFKGDVGFRVFKLDSSNIKAWEANHDDLAASLEAHAKNLKVDRTEQDILFELVLKLGLDLAVPMQRKKVAGSTTKGHDVHSIGGGVMLVCLSESIKREDVEQLAMGIIAWHKEQAPGGDSTVVFRDSAFADDVAKTNLVAILRQHDLYTVLSL